MTKKVKRFEAKYLINSNIVQDLKMSLGRVMELDKNTDISTGQYHVESLYFETLWDNNLNEKAFGLHDRQKLRLRLYNHDIETLKLELKIKENQYSTKLAAKTTKLQLKQFLRGDFTSIVEHSPRLYELIISSGRTLIPKSVVSYDRVPFYLPINNTRITLDLNIHGSTFFSSFPTNGKNYKQKLTPIFMDVLEIKYDGMLPNVIGDILSNYRLNRAAISKYTLARQINHFSRFSDYPILHF